jgi:hypothetical protein
MIEKQMPVTTYIAVKVEESVNVGLGADGKYYKVDGETFTAITVKDAAIILIGNISLATSEVFSPAMQYIASLIA